MARALLPLSLSLILVGCAAMQRTWLFDARATDGEALAVRQVEARVTRDVLALRLRLENTTDRAVAISAGRVVLRLPDGQLIEAQPSLLELGERAAKGFLAQLGVLEADDPRTQPGSASLLLIRFREPRKDLRRYPRMEVDISRIAVDGRPAGIPPVVLSAPPDAPLGQDV